MGAIAIIRRYQQLKDVDWASFDDLDVPQWSSAISSFVGVSMGGGGGGGGSFSLGVSTGGNTLGLTGVTGSRVVLAGDGAITLSQSRDANGATITISGATQTPQSVQTQGLFDLSLGGNTAGAPQLVSSGTLTLAGGSNITLSQNGNAISVIGPGTFPETQTAISGIGNSQTTYSSGTVNLLGLGAITVRSTTGQAFQLSVNAQSVQPETQTFVGGVAGSDATYTSGTVQLTGSGIVTVRSSAGQRIVVDASQSAQTQNVHNVTLAGNTAGALAQVSSGTLTLAGGQGITLSQVGNAVTISGAAAASETQSGISGIGNSQTTYTSGTVNLSGLGAITVRSTTGNAFQLSVNSQTVQPETQTFVGGVANSQTTYTSGTVSLGELGAITIRSTTGNQLQLSVNAQSVQPETQTFLGGLAGSNTTYTSGTVSLTGVGGGVTVSSNTGQRIDISVAAPVAQTVQTQNVVDVTITGNTSGAGALVSSGTLSLAGGNNITLSQAGNAITISGANAAGAQTGISGIVGSNATYTSGTVTFTGVGGGITVSSNTGQRIDLSVAAQTAESQTIGMSNIGNTSGTTGVASGAQVRFLLAGGNNVTLSQSLNGASGTLTISAAAQTNQAGSLFAVGNSTSSSSGTYDARTLSLRGDGMISVAATNSGFRISATQSVVTLTGNTAGAMAALSSGTLSLAGGNNITLSQAGNAVTISGANVGGAQTGISGIANSQTTYTSGTVSLSELGAITIRSTTGNQFQLSVNAQSVQPETQTFVGGIIASDTTYTSGSVRLTGVGGGVTVSSNTGQRVDISVAAPVAQTVQTQNLHNVTLSGNTAGVMAQVSSGTLTLAGGNNITLSQAGNAVTISAAAGAETQVAISGLANSQTTYTSGTVSLSELGAITIRSTTGNQFQLSVNSQSVQTQGQMSAGVSTGGNTAGDTGVTGTRLVFVGSQNITLSQATAAAGGTITIQGPTTAAQTNQTGGGYAVGNTYSSSSGTFDARTLSIRGDGIISVAATNSGWRISASQSVQAETQTFVGGLAGSNTTYTSGTITITGVGGGITVSSNTGQRIDLSVAAPVAQTAESQSIGISNIGNTSGTTGIASGAQVRMLFAGGNNVTLSQSLNGASGTITISAFNQTVQTQNLVDVTISGNTAGAGALVSSGTLTLAGGNNITVSQAGNAITISGANVGGAQTGISSIVASDATYTSGSVQFTGSGIVTIRSSANQRVVVDASQSAQTLGMYAVQNTTGESSSTTMDARTISVAGDGAVSAGYSAGSLRISAPAVSVISAVAPLSTSTNGSTISILGPPSFSAGVSTVGNSSGDTGITGSRLVFAGINNITLSQSTNASGGTVSISGPTVGGAQTGISGLANSQTTYTSGTVSLGELGAITIRSTTGNQFQFSVNAQSVQPETQTFVGGIKNSQTTFTSGTIGLSELGAITVRSTTGNQFQLSVAAQSVQPETQTFVGGIIASDTTYTSGSIRFTGVGGGVTVSSNTGQRVDISVAAPVAATGISGIANSQTTYTSGTVSLSELGAITIRSTTGNQFQLSVAAQTAESQSIGMSNIGNTSGTTGIASGAQVRMLFAGGNNVTLSQSLNGASGTITISAAAQSAQTGISGLANSQTTYTSGTVSLSELGAITIRSTTGNQYQLSVNAQTGTQFSAGISGGNTSGDTGTVAGRLVLAGGNNITLSGSTNGVSETISISAFTQSVESQSIGMSNLGNTAGTTGIASGGQVRFLIVGTNNISLSQSLNGASGTISISGQPSFSAGLSTGGNTQGNTGVSGTRLVLVATNNITMSQNTDASGATISISGQSPTGGQFSAGVSNLGNSAGATGISGSQLVLVGTNNITLSQTTGANGATVSISGPAAGGFSLGLSTGGNTSGDTGVTGTRVVLVGDSPVSLSQATGTAGATISIDAPATSSLVGASGLSISTNGSTISVYPVNASSHAPYDEAVIVTGQQGQGSLHLTPVRVPNVQFDRIALGFNVSNATNSSNSFTISAWIGVYTRNASTLSLLVSTSGQTNFSGSGTVGSYSLYGGSKHMTLGWTSTLSASDYWIGINVRTTTGGGAGHSISQLLMSKLTNSAWSGVMGVGSNATDQRLLGQGVYSLSTAGMPSAIGFTDIQGSGSLALRPPIWHLRSGTV